MPFKKDTSLNEKDSLTDLLLLEKSLIKLYAEALTEGSCKCYITAVKNNLGETACDQNSIFQQMEKLDYYQTVPADKTTIDEKKATFKKVLSELES